MIGFYYVVARERKFTLKMKANSTVTCDQTCFFFFWKAGETASEYKGGRVWSQVNSTAKSSIKSGNQKHNPHSKSFFFKGGPLILPLVKEHEKEGTCFAYYNNLRKRENSKQIVILFLSEINTLLSIKTFCNASYLTGN